MAETTEQSKSALKKAEKDASMAAQKAERQLSRPPSPWSAARRRTTSSVSPCPRPRHSWQWYQEVVLKAEMIEYYTEISGFFIMRPATMHIWNYDPEVVPGAHRGAGGRGDRLPYVPFTKVPGEGEGPRRGLCSELAWSDKGVSPRPRSPSPVAPLVAEGKAISSIEVIRNSRS